ncbi:MAG: PAS-domain containing protein, partial [Pseudomonadota bacterium]|nr:PAS-domain containing protein [Pseudomonadota bacterium]
MFIWFAVVATVVCLSIMAAAIKRDHMFFTQNQRANVTRELNLIARTLDEKLFTIELVSHRIAATVSSSDSFETSQRGVDQIASRLRQQYPDIISIAIAPDLKVNHVSPLKGNEAVLGIEYWNLPDQFVGIARAYRERSPVFLGPINLVQGGRGFIVRYPVFVPNGAGKTGDRFWGVISVVLAESGLFSGAGPQASPLTIGLREMDGRGGERSYLAGNAALFNADPVVLPLSAVGDKWQIGALPTGGWRAQSPNLILLIVGGLFVTGLLLTALMLIRRSTMQQAAAHNILVHAIEALDEGFILYDINDRVVMYNEKFLTYWNRTADEIRPGTKFETLLRLGVRDGEFEDAIGREEEWIAERLAARDAGQTTLQRMSDGRWLKSSDARTPDGYSVGIRSDVTHQKNAQLAAEKAN